MRGVLLAGGEGTRLRPLTNAVNKHLLPVGDVPMIVHPLRKLVRAGIEEVLVVSSPAGVGELARALGSGAEHGCELSYRVQQRPAGIADALSLATGFGRGEPLVVVLGDNLFEDELEPHLASYEGEGALVFVKRVPDPERYGVARIEGARITSIVEKPDSSPSDLAVTGIYVYDGRAGELLRRLRPSARGELEITDLNLAYLEQGLLGWRRLEGEWLDAGTLEAYRAAQHGFGAR